MQAAALPVVRRMHRPALGWCLDLLSDAHSRRHANTWKQTEAWGPGQSGGGSNASSRFGEQFSGAQWSGGRTNCRTPCFPRCPGDMNAMRGVLLFVRRTHRESTFPSRKCCRSTQVKWSVEVKMIWIPSHDDSQARTDVGQIQDQQCHLCAAWEYAKTHNI